MKLKRPLKGSESGADVRMVQRALNKAPARTVITVTGRYDDATRRRMRAFRQARSLNPGDHFDQEALDALEPYFDRYGRMRYRLFVAPKPARPVPNLGPVVPGGKSILEHDLTHATSGIPRYPAFDDGWVPWRQVIAPEPLTVVRHSSAQGGEAFYASGRSRVRYWFGHVDRPPPIGRTFQRGEVMCRISPDHRIPHVHVGVNVEQLLGIGRELQHRTDYSHGAEKVGAQLRRALT